MQSNKNHCGFQILALNLNFVGKSPFLTSMYFKFKTGEMCYTIKSEAFSEQAV